VNIYELTRAYWNYCFANPEKLKPIEANSSVAVLKGEEAEIIINPAKMTMVGRAVMPGGKPDMKAVKGYPSIVKLVENFGQPTLIKAIFLLIQNYCASVNVVRNMDVNQMTDAAIFLLEECESCRLEDYYIMFQMAKRGQLKINDGKGIMDRIDITIITQIHSGYLNFRAEEGIRLREERDNELRMERLNSTQKLIGGEEPKIIELPEGYLENELAKIKNADKAKRDADFELFKQNAPARKLEKLNRLAEELGMDPQELHEKSIATPSFRTEHLDAKIKPKKGQIILDNVVPLEPKKKKDSSA